MREVRHPEVKRHLPRERGKKFEAFQMIVVSHLERARECRVIPFSSLRDAPKYLGGEAEAEIIGMEAAFLVEARAQNVVGKYKISAGEARGVVDGGAVPIDEESDRGMFPFERELRFCIEGCPY